MAPKVALSSGSSSNSRSQSTATSGVEAILCGLILAAHVPFFVLYLRNLWQWPPHYGFFPVLLAASAYLLWQRWPRPAGPRTRLSCFCEWELMVSGFVCLCTAVLLYSPWLGAIATLLTMGGVLFRLAGQATFKALLPPWLLLWLVIPPPWRLDFELIRWLQSLTSKAATILLDLLGVHHLLAGNVIRFPEKELFVAEACSGVHSQLVLVACCAIFAVVAGRKWIQSVLLLASAVFWAAVANIARVTIVAFAYGKYDLDISTGWQHEVLGYVLVGGGFLMLVSTDQLLCGLLSPVLKGGKPPANSLSRLWNWSIAPMLNNDAIPTDPDPFAGGSATSPSPVRSVHAAFGGAGLFGCVGVLQLVMLLLPGGPQTDVPSAPQVDAEQLDVAFDKESLAAEVDGWRQTDYFVERRGRNDEDGECSQVWIYQTDNYSMNVSVDYLFQGWHELTRCYEARGWQLASRQVKSPDEGQHASGAGEYVEVELQKPTGEHRLLFFGLFDAAGHPITPPTPGSHWRELPARLAAKLAANPLLGLFGGRQSVNSPVGRTIQVQQLTNLHKRPSNEERAAAQQRFLVFRDALRDRWVKVDGS